jgi:hypothetical protein
LDVRLKLVDQTVKADTALLQVLSPKQLEDSNVQPLDIALHLLPKGSTYVTIGYPGGKDEPNDQTADWQGPHQGDDRMEVKQYVDDGSSGSPFIDENGAAVATCVEEVGRTECLYVPLLDAEELLQRIPPGKKSISLDHDIRGRPPEDDTRRKLINTLHWVPGNISNLDLYSWAYQASKHKKDYETARPYFECPVFQALSDRRLGDSDAVQTIASLGSPTVQGQLMLASAEQSLIVGPQ